MKLNKPTTNVSSTSCKKETAVKTMRKRGRPPKRKNTVLETDFNIKVKKPKLVKSNSVHSSNISANQDSLDVSVKVSNEAEIITNNANNDIGDQLVTKNDADAIYRSIVDQVRMKSNQSTAIQNRLPDAPLKTLPLNQEISNTSTEEQHPEELKNEIDIEEEIKEEPVYDNLDQPKTSHFPEISNHSTNSKTASPQAET